MTNNKYTLIGLNILVWIIITVWLTFAYMGIADIQTLLVRNIITAICMASLVYLNFYYLLPKYLFRGKYVLYFTILSALVFTMSIIRTYIDGYFLVRLVPTMPEDIALFSNMHYAITVISFVVVLLISSLFKFTSVYYKNIQLRQQLENQQLEAELKFLKAQINPHFLFNTLNNIYTLSYMQSAKATPMIMKLSELMRYMLYDSNQSKVMITKEIQYLENYIDLQRLKMPNEQNISFEVIGNTQGILIEPMLLVPLLENSFKHGDIGDNEAAWVNSMLEINKIALQLTVRNSLPTAPKKKDKQGGIGLENIEKRLQLLYPNKHEFVAEKRVEQNEFYACIKILF
ncbi:MAG: sensor histidine kinase [Chitinophagales bacterium]